MKFCESEFCNCIIIFVASHTITSVAQSLYVGANLKHHSSLPPPLPSKARPLDRVAGTQHLISKAIFCNSLARRCCHRWTVFRFCRTRRKQTGNQHLHQWWMGHLHQSRRIVILISPRLLPRPRVQAHRRHVHAQSRCVQRCRLPQWRPFVPL